MKMKRLKRKKENGKLFMSKYTKVEDAVAEIQEILEKNGEQIKKKLRK